MDHISQSAVAEHHLTATWRPNPGVRGTFEIITTCLSTLIICVWSAVHVDVPLRQSARVNGIGKVGWIFTGLVSPDLLLYAACCQLSRAHVLLQVAQTYLHVEAAHFGTSRLSRYCNYVTGSRQTPQLKQKHSERIASDKNDCIDSKESSEPALVECCGILPPTSSHSRTSQDTPSRKNQWTLTHAFYGVMGGFVLETSSSILEGERRFVLTLSGLRFVLEHAPNLLPDLSVREIQLKGRSDVLAKTLLILQLLNFCVSCAARRAQSLPLSLLEVFTLAHALCTVITCIIWWRKPFGVLEPTYITGDRADELAAYMLFTSPMHKDYFAGLVWYQCAREASYLETTIATKEGLDDAAHSLPSRLLPGEFCVINGYRFKILPDKPPDPNRRLVFGRTCEPWYHRRRGRDHAVTLSAEDATRWSLVARGLARYGTHQLDLERPRALISRHGGLQMSVFKHAGPDETRWWPAVSLAIATAYGAIHFIAWDAQFPTRVERTLWRYAAVTLIVLGLAFFQYSAIPRSRETLGRVSAAVFHMCLLFYPLASGFVLLESVRQLLYLPDEAYQVPNLSNYLPHFS